MNELRVRCKNLVLWSSCSLKTRELFSVCIFFEESVFIFHFLNDKTHNYDKQNIIVNFITQKFEKINHSAQFVYF